MCRTRDGELLLCVVVVIVVHTVLDFCEFLKKIWVTYAFVGWVLFDEKSHSGSAHGQKTYSSQRELSYMLVVAFCHQEAFEI